MNKPSPTASVTSSRSLMPATWRRYGAWLLIGLLLPYGAAASAVLEQLEYRVSYRGPFSLGRAMPIADLVLETRAPGEHAVLRETRLEASSSAYPIVEALYPMRYRFRSWTLSDGRGLVGLETFERTRERRHRLFLRDASPLGMVDRDPDDPVAQTEIARLAAGELPAAGGAGVFDRLGLLAQIRGRDLALGAGFRFPVTNGKERYVYKVEVEAVERLRLGAEQVASWRLRIEATQASSADPAKAAHRPLYLWLSQAPGHIPLRLESRHPVGLFRIDLADGRQGKQLALRVP